MKKKTKRSATKKKRAVRARVFLRPIPQFPTPGPKDCFEEGTPFTARGSKNLNVNIDLVKLYIGTGEAINGTITNGATTWIAVFGDINTAADLPNNTSCRLVIEFTDGNQEGQLAFRFTHIAPPARVEFEYDPGANHTLSVSGATQNTDDLTVRVDGNEVDPNFSASSQTFAFTTPSTSSETQDVVFRAKNNHGEDVQFPCTFLIDQEAPEFDPDPPAMTQNGEVFIEGDAIDTGSGFASVNDLTVVLSGINGTIDPEDYDVEKSLSVGKKTLSFEITIDKSILDPDQYTVSITAKDLAGNEGNTFVQFNIA